MSASMGNAVLCTLSGRLLAKKCIKWTVIPRLLSTTSVLAGAGTTQQNARWNLYGGICLERKPVISPPLKPIEFDYAKVLTEMEMELSMLNDHELQHLEDIRRKERMASGTDVTDVDLEASAKQTAQDFEDLANDEFSKFQPASRTTAADLAGDWHTSLRKLDRHLLLAIKMKQSAGWTLPMCMHQSGETLRQTAERALSLHCGNNLMTRAVGNAPIGFYKFKYNSKYSTPAGADGAVGGKIFFFRAYYKSGQVDTSLVKDIIDYGWLTRTELDTLMESKDTYLKCLKKFLVDEDFSYSPSSKFIDKYSSSSFSLN